jgi:hypothetical protein
MTTASSTDQLLEAWRTARREAEDAHRRAMADADKLYQAWLTAQQDAAVRSAALTTATWEDRLGAMKVLGDVTLHMRKPGDWYASHSNVGISNGAIVSSGAGNGRTPEEAVNDLWRGLTQISDGEWIAVGHGDNRINAVWDGDAWKTWKPQRVSE